MRTSTTETSGRCSTTAATSDVAVADRGHHDRAGVLDEPDEALAQEDRILGDDHPERGAFTCR